MTFIAADVPGWIGDTLGDVLAFLGQFSALDWVLVAFGVAVPVLAWRAAIAPARLGTIVIDDIEVDDDSCEPKTTKAELQRHLARRGWLPPSGVPSGSPTVAALEDAISAAPVPQAQWIATLLKLLPSSPAATSFKITATLSVVGGGGDDDRHYRLRYRLVRVAPRPEVQVLCDTAPTRAAVIEQAAIRIYLEIGRMAPEIYPTWAHFSSAEALLCYRRGLEAEEHDPMDDGVEPGERKVTARYRSAYDLYREVIASDPDNMLARLRAANCVERGATGARKNGRMIKRQIEALEAYASVRLRQPTIFEAGFRAGVLLALLAEWKSFSASRTRALRRVLIQLERANARKLDDADKAAAEIAQLEGAALRARLRRAAQRETGRARRQLRPFWVVVHEHRWRHRFEPTGSERRQLRKALGISKMCHRARRNRAVAADHPGREASDLVQYAWRAWVYWRFMAGRRHLAGWHAHYNAACFYALLPHADKEHVPFGSWRARRRALKHLGWAIDAATDELPCAYVRDEDPDLAVLRKHNPAQFEAVMARVCPSEVVVFYERPNTRGKWGLHVWGTAVIPTEGGPWEQPLKPVEHTTECAVYRVRIVDENGPLAFLAHRGDTKDAVPQWVLTPTELPDRRAWVVPGDPRVFVHPPRLVTVRLPGDGGAPGAVWPKLRLVGAATDPAGEASPLVEPTVTRVRWATYVLALPGGTRPMAILAEDGRSWPVDADAEDVELVIAPDAAPPAAALVP
jgi:hypothetical protein